MARFARVDAVETAHHITQRGNSRRLVFETDAQRVVYLKLLKHYSQQHALTLIGYCLMSNHVHLVGVPKRPSSMALALRDTHGRYATYVNARQEACGHVWQGRYYSCPLDGNHLWRALRYTERNPVRAGLVAQPAEYSWSSAGAHCGGEDWLDLLDGALFGLEWTPASWCAFLGAVGGDEGSDEEAIRRNTHTGRPLGSAEFVRDMEQKLERSLARQKGGRPPKRDADPAQACLEFAVASSRR